MILFNNEVIPLGQFPNGETYIPKPFFAKHQATHHLVTAQQERNVVTLKYESDADLFRLFLVRKSLWFPCDLRITYFPYSRMDRNSNSYIFTLKSVAKFINMMEWDHVILYEPHSDVTPALLNHCKVIDVTASSIMQSKINIALGTDYQVCYPDVGAFKRYSEKFKTGDPLIGLKLRDFETGKIITLQIIGDKNLDSVAIVDDLCSKGGTFILAAQRLKEMGFKKILLAVTHCEKTIFSGKIFESDLIDTVITTDSILDTNEGHDNLKIIPLSEFRW